MKTLLTTAAVLIGLAASVTSHAEAQTFPASLQGYWCISDSSHGKARGPSPVSPSAVTLRRAVEGGGHHAEAAVHDPDRARGRCSDNRVHR